MSRLPQTICITGNYSDFESAVPVSATRSRVGPANAAEQWGNEMKSLATMTLAAAAAGLLLHNAVAQTPPPGVPGPNDTWKLPNREAMNANTVTVITAPAGGATSVFGSDMARVLDDTNVRVLTVLGKGPVHNVTDVLSLKAIDMGVVVADVPEFYQLQYKIPDITSQLRYIVKLYNNEIHVVAPTAVKSIFDLAGKRIVASTDVGYYAAKVIFHRLNMDASFDYWTDDASAIQKIVDGEADAYIGSTGKVFGLLRTVKNEDHRLHLVTVPYDRRLQDLYLPTTLSSDEYPNLLTPGETIDTIATSDLLVTFNWPEKSERYRRVANFVNAFFSKFSEFQKPPRHPKWKEASISAVVPGWTRFKAAQDWIDNWHAQQANADKTASLASFKEFMAQQGHANLSQEELAKLYAQFQEWNHRIRN
jgi:TRAP-type uncharacterized transport system substrate-binding protein